MRLCNGVVLRAETKWKAAGDGFFVSRCKAEGGGKKPPQDVAGIRSRGRAAPSSFGQTKPIGFAVGVAFANDVGMTTCASVIGLIHSTARHR